MSARPAYIAQALGDPPACVRCGSDSHEDCGRERRQPAQHNRPVVRIIALGDAPPEPGEWVVDGIVPEGFTLLYGESGAGKTFWACWLAVKVAASQRTVVYVAAEGGSAILRRLEAAQAASGNAGPLPVLVIPQAVQLGSGASDADVVALAEAVAAEVQRRGLPPVGLLVVDTLARTLGGNENASEDMAAYVRHVDVLREQLEARETRPSALVVHHAGWQSDRERGSSALRAAADAVLALVGGAKAEPGERIKRVRLLCKKLKDAEEFAPVELELRQVVVTRRDGEPLRDKQGHLVTTCVVAEGQPHGEPEPAPVQTNTEQVLAFVARHPGLSVRAIVSGLAEAGIRKGRNTVAGCLERAHDRGLVVQAAGGWAVAPEVAPEVAPVALSGSESHPEPRAGSGSAGSLPVRESQRATREASSGEGEA